MVRRMLVYYAIVYLLALIVFFVAGCAGTGIERRTYLLPDEISISQEIETETLKLEPHFKIGFKWKFK